MKYIKRLETHLYYKHWLQKYLFNEKMGLVFWPYVKRIVQIMIQATDLAQILYGGHPLRKKRGPRKTSISPPFSNMAAMGYPEILFFALKGQQMVEKEKLW